MTKKYLQLLSDYNYIKSKYGHNQAADQSDFVLFELLEEPTEKRATKILMSILEDYFNYGYLTDSGYRKLPIENDIRIKEIMKKWKL